MVGKTFISLHDLRLLRENPLRFLEYSASHYGDLVHLPLGIMNVYLVNHPAGIQHVLLDNHRNYSKDTFQYNQLATITGQGLLTSDGELWLRQRRLAQPAFHRGRIAGLAKMMTEAAQAMLNRWEAAAQSDQTLDLDAEMMRLSLEIVGKALFSIDLSARAEKLTHAALTALDHLIYRSRNPFSLPDAFPTQKNRRFRAALNTLDQAVYAILGERRAGLEIRGHPDANSDLLDMLLAARDEKSGEGMNDRQLRDEIITLLIAGHETVASALTWTWYLLANHPQIENRLYAEIGGVLAGKPPTAADLPHLAFTEAVFNEALRLYPPAWIITRKALEQDSFHDLQIKPNSLVVISPYTIHRHPGFWNDPERFDPGRFTPENSASRPRFAFIPFGAGPRLCIGDSFARVEAQLILACIAQRYRLELADPQNVQIEALVTLRPRHGLPVRIRRI